MEHYKYDELASTMKIEVIASDEHNQEILRRLRDSDPEFGRLCMCNEGQIWDENDFYPDNGEELGWLGYFLGKNTTVNDLYIRSTPSPSCNAGVEDFRRGMGRNSFIRSIIFGCHRLNGQIFYLLDLFFRNNNNLIEFVVSECDLGVDNIRQLSLALGNCNKSLKKVKFDTNAFDNGRLVDIIAALGMHPQLEELALVSMDIGRNEFTALSTLLRNTTKQLQTLDLCGNNIDDEGVEALAHAISGSQLQVLDLSYNPTITIRGWKTLATLLEMPASNLEEVYLNNNNNIGDEGALMFASAPRGNCKLKVLTLHGNRITAEGWAHFTRLLCDTSSINNTYLSNHKLRDLATIDLMPYDELPTNLRSSLELNASSEDKEQIAMTKILQHHSHFNVQPFFEWEFKVLPLLVNWLEKARTRTSDFDEKIKRTKLSITYDFVREFPMLYIEPVTSKEIEECSALEVQLQGGQYQQAKLEGLQKRKDRAMRRLL